MVNLFFKKLFGQLPATEKYVKHNETLREEMNRFDTFAKGDKLSRFYELETIIQSQEHINTKKKLQELKYQGSEEHKLELEFQNLSKNKELQLFFKVKESDDFSRFENIKQSDNHLEYLRIKKMIDSGEIEKIKQQLAREHQDELSIAKRFKKLESDSTLKNYFKLLKTAKYLNYQHVINSEKLNEYQTLKKEVEAFNYKQINNKNKEQFQTELDKHHKYLALSKDKELKEYLAFIKKQYPKFIETVTSSQVYHDYNELKQYLESEEHKQKLENTLFESSEEAKLLINFKALEQSPDTKFYNKFNASKEFKTYQNILNSPILTRFNELQTYINSDVFKEQKSYLLDPKKFEKSEGFQHEQELKTLKSDDEIIWYFKLKKSNKFDTIRQWNPIFEEKFENFDNSKWISVPFQGMLNLQGRSYVPEGNMQFHTNGNNLSFESSCINIETRKENTSGLRWQTSSGFKMRDFEYTSGMINTGHSFRFKEGKIEILARMTSSKDIVHALFLKSENIAPHIDVFCTGSSKGLKTRLFLTNKNKPDFEETITGINPESNFLYSLEWHNNSLKWQINGYTIAEYSGKLPEIPLYLGLSSVMLEKTENLPANLVVDTIRVYEKQN